MKKSQLFIFPIGILLIFGWYYFNPSSSQSSNSYNQHIQPVLAAKCYTCHGPDKEKMKAGLRLDIRESLLDTLESGNTALNPIDFSKSEIIKRIVSSDPEFMMPPPDAPKQLAEDEIEVIRKWVEEGAKWENHWAFEPLKKQAPPEISEDSWSQNPIDPFIYQKQEKLGLQHAPEADKRTLLRRLTYDLHGLPPTPEQMKAFLEDEADVAYSRLVDTLLSSPRYGERWARHWLDVVHYGETHGYDKDKRRPNAWHYRDYVIDAFNKDLPYSRFIEDQIAGDVLYPDDPQSTVATGFLAAGPWDLVGHVEVRDGTVDKRIVRNLDRDDIVSSVMATFTGLTVQCARCHDHKFDPIKQADYYSLQAVFAGIDRADRQFDKNPKIHQTRLHLKQEKQELESQLDGLGLEMNEKVKNEITQVQKQQKETSNKISGLRYPRSKTFGFHSAIEQQSDVEKWVQIDLGSIHNLEKIVLAPAHPTEGLTMPGYGFPLRFVLEVSTTVDFSSAKTIVDFSKENHHERTDRPYVIEVANLPSRFIRLTANRLWKGRDQDHFLAMAEIQAFENGKNVARNAKVKAIDSFKDNRWDPIFLTDGFNSHGLMGGEPLPTELQKDFDKAERELTVLRDKENKILRSVLTQVEKTQLDRIRSFLMTIEDSLSQLPAPSYVYAAATEFNNQYQFTPTKGIRAIHRLNRGDTEQPMEEMFAGTVEVFEGMPNYFDLPEGHSEGDRRAALAKWSTDQQNALTWRSIVNRIWKYHFGRGIVATPNDFGKMGTPPSHPELLDFLAEEFLDNGQSIKWLHKLIVTSATYKQQSFQDRKNYQIDSENRYLWKSNRRQLEAEAIRDGVLAVSGKLDLTMGGPGFDAFRYEDDHSPRYLYKDYDAYDPSSFRRAIYRFIVRSVPDPFMSTLDCADPSQSVPVRNETVTALQALSALNNPFMVRQSAFFAERLEKEKTGLKPQLFRAFELALQREPDETELSELEEYANKHGLPAACRLIYAMNEFLYTD